MRHQITLLFLIGVLVEAMHGTSLAAKSRFNAYLDGGSAVTVDNASSMTDAWVAGLVLAADRSTQEDCPYDPPSYKGLFQSGDRIFVCDNYLAWFDYTTNDGKVFTTPPYGAKWERSGALAGFWTLDPDTQYFKYWRTGPNNCWNWARNELIPGSASPNQEQHWWDKYAPPLEHAMAVVSGSNWFFMAYHYSKQTPHGQFTVIADGVEDATGAMRYKTSARMTSWANNVDVVDGNDGNGIANYIQANIEYRCRNSGIQCIWNFKPHNADVILDNIFIYLWTAYAQDVDGTDCDAGGAGSQWPSTVYGQPMYNQSSHTLYLNVPASGPYAPGTIVQMMLGTPCSNPHYNVDIYSYPPFAIGHGSWLINGESPTLSTNLPRWHLINHGVPGTGGGTEADPELFAWRNMLSWNETHDGTLGFGLGRGPFTNPDDYITLSAGTWYQASFALRVPSFRGDYDNDGDVDQEDFGRLQACYSGAGIAYQPGCEYADADLDGDVDQDDYAHFLSCLSGPNIPTSCQ
ncbi:MAG: hypothetical protein GXY44_13875 [Phycisphaerales bacterium]|nr:hypothetical protein [Phycisphaerales bacterium]